MKFERIPITKHMNYVRICTRKGWPAQRELYVPSTYGWLRIVAGLWPLCKQLRLGGAHDRSAESMRQRPETRMAGVRLAYGDGRRSSDHAG